MESILVVDDDELVARSIDRALSMYGYDVDIAYNGNDAIEKAAHKNYDIILSDIRMPFKDGIDTVNKIGGYSKKLLMTGYCSFNERELKTKCLIKPFGIDELLAHIK